MALRTRPERVLPVPSSSYPTPARRPLNSRLDGSRLARSFGLRMPPWQWGVDRMLAETR
jgi:dTDP-4-dehydrorhamnose reductase